ncbi:hypothetical protein SCLCIDRAFT_1028780 [Scleroderma citrinum Foug A]|uniref:Uncharacterized protein n=1 Tax=Scleroderma citrinum Foug A TaxID=1036808 RepID=A0A0C3DSY2_9AGAM|nr:hypothetical protein SCLCIDRAFT_1028780 [Scleroderma citrinum Foug A]
MAVSLFHRLGFSFSHVQSTSSSGQRLTLRSHLHKIVFFRAVSYMDCKGPFSTLCTAFLIPVTPKIENPSREQPSLHFCLPALPLRLPFLREHVWEGHENRLCASSLLVWFLSVLDLLVLVRLLNCSSLLVFLSSLLPWKRQAARSCGHDSQPFSLDTVTSSLPLPGVTELVSDATL